MFTFSTDLNQTEDNIQDLGTHVLFEKQVVAAHMAVSWVRGTSIAAEKGVL